MSELQDSGNSAVDLAALDYLRGVKSSTCLLLPTTPSPTSLHINHPLSDQMNDDPYLGINDDNNMVSLQNVDLSAGDSSSSADSNSVIQDPVSAQLINNISMLDYQTLSKTGDIIVGPSEDSKLNGNFNTNNRKLPSFVNWNWNIIRKVLLWVVVSGLVACLAAIVAMTVTMPRSCNPELPWYQGKVFYEIFPASFEDSNDDGIGDLKGLIMKLDTIKELGVSAIRLNCIFEAHNNNYTEQSYNVTSLLNIDKNIGTLNDFKDLVIETHKRNMSLVLDFPVSSMADMPATNVTNIIYSTNDSLLVNADDTSKAIVFWARIQSVDGFYLKNLEKYVDNPNFIKSLQFWKHIIGHDKILISDEAAYRKASGDALHVLLSRIDLVDIHLDLQNGTSGLKDRIEEVICSSLWSQPFYPWVLWNIGNIHNNMLIRHENNTLTLLTLNFILPGTINLYHVDEIGLEDIPLHNNGDNSREYGIITHMMPMSWSNINVENDLPRSSWNSNSPLKPHNHYLEVLKSLTNLRLNTPTIYLKAIYKEGNILKNTEVRKSEDNLVIIERWYPRRNTCVFVGNLGNKAISTDLSSMFYGGIVIAGTNSSLIGEVLYLDEITLPPYSAIILKLEK
ncbi:Oligo-1,6-glucosidase [Eumeta japonica]|uniref:Oligo-1,6-glucosidase n=1 Tax=Eumeta variegata TaxID=151549 RepID=A0A4C1ZL32_EUMVA|nr:Oligo-1,6-glucosidase [Eumeta japonica]